MTGRHPEPLSADLLAHGALRRGFGRTTFPLLAALAWWVACYLVYLVGWPVPYVRTNVLMVTLLLLACAIGLLVGYICIRPHRPAPTSSPPLAVSASSEATTAPLPSGAPGAVATSGAPSTPERVPFPVVAGVVALVALVGPVVSTYSGFRLGQFDEALLDQGAAFSLGSNRILEERAGRTGLLAVQTVLAPLTLLALPFLSALWFERRRGGLLLIAAVAVPVVTSIMTGRDQQLGWSGVMVVAGWLVSRWRRQRYVEVRDVVLAVILSAIGAVAFAARKASRMSLAQVCPPGATSCVFVDGPPTLAETTGYYVGSYAAHGFEGLGRALEATWAFGGGMSHAPALSSIIYPLSGFQPVTVSSQLDALGWSDTWYWSTALTSIANDVPWVLIPLVFVAQGLVLAASWRRAVAAGDALSVAVFALTWLGVLFTPQNLQLTASGPSYVGYLVLVAVFVGRALAERAVADRRLGRRHPALR